MKPSSLLLGCAFTLITACGGASTEVSSPEVLPHVDNLVIYDVPIETAPTEVQTMWREYERAKTAVLPRPENTSMEALDTWANHDFLPWIDSQTAAVNHFGNLPQNERAIDRVFASVLSADILYGVVQALLDMPIPDEVRGNAQAERLYVSTIAEQLLAVAQTTRDLLSSCQESAQETTAPFNAWAQRCAEMSSQIQNEITEFQ